MTSPNEIEGAVEAATAYAKRLGSQSLFALHLRTILDALASITRERDGYQKHLRACEQIAGKALGYPWFKDDQANFPGTTEAEGVCIGEHVGDTIVEELATRFEAVTQERDAILARAQGPGHGEAVAWRPMTPDMDHVGPAWCAVRVYTGGKFLRWDVHYVEIDDETGEIAADFEQGWALNDYEFWMPIVPPAPPAATPTREA